MLDNQTLLHLSRETRRPGDLVDRLLKPDRVGEGAAAEAKAAQSL